MGYFHEICDGELSVWLLNDDDCYTGIEDLGYQEIFVADRVC